MLFLTVILLVLFAVLAGLFVFAILFLDPVINVRIFYGLSVFAALLFIVVMMWIGHMALCGFFGFDS